MNKDSVSVCMATYNGSKYISRQLSSIIHQLTDEDEIIIVDDCSRDDTVLKINFINDKRIKIFVNEINVGSTQSFARSLSFAEKEIIVLSDQDDVWMDNKLSVIRQNFNSDRDLGLLMHDAIVVNSEMIVINESLFDLRKTSTKVLSNIISCTFYGCCMAFRKDSLQYILPIPKSSGVHHDLWIGMIMKLTGRKVLLTEEKLINFIRHGNNTSTLTRRKINVIVSEKILFSYYIVRQYIMLYLLRIVAWVFNKQL
jgi:glycosyltransferase involved in cell wall biosynthesis